ncbi:MAG: Chloride channel protein EriC, partial [Algoriphagus marincola HL-49]
MTFKSFGIYFFQWLLGGLLIGLMTGSASAFFLVSLEWATDYRESHRWIIALLPMGGFLIGWTYHKIGQNSL